MLNNLANLNADQQDDKRKGGLVNTESQFPSRVSFYWYTSYFIKIVKKFDSQNVTKIPRKVFDPLNRNM